MPWMEILQTFGFPIFSVCVMAWYTYDQTEKSRADRKEESDRHKSEVDNLATVIQNNTIALTKLVDKLGERADG